MKRTRPVFLRLEIPAQALRSVIGSAILPCFLIAILGCFCAAGAAEQPKDMPKQDVVEVPAIGQDLCVSNVFQSNMVVQRDKPLKIWGWAAPGETVTVSIAGQEASATAAADRSWQVTLKPMPANSSPQTISVKGKATTVTLENVLVGDVWVMGGQSNMAFPINKVDDGELEIVSANFPQIRLLTIPTGKGFDSVLSFERLYEWSDWSKRHFRRGNWDVCSPESVREFSAIGYVFGRRLAMASNVPIGLIDTSEGGTTVEAWTPDEVLRKIDGAETRDMMKEWDDKIAAFNPKADLEVRIANYNKNIEKMKAKGNLPPTDLRPGPATDKNRPGCRYASAVRPLSGLAVKGTVFHQGFNNCFNGSAGARMYYQVFGGMIAAWRKTFGDPQMPFCIISLCTAGEPQTQENFVKPMLDAGPDIREAQYKTFLDLYNAGDKNIGFISSFDQRKSFYHPQIKIPVGERAAKWALASHYGILGGKNAEDYWLPPLIKEVKIVDQTIHLTMSTELRMKDESEDKLLGFSIAGEDRKFVPAAAEYLSDGTKDNRGRPNQTRSAIVLSSPFVSKPMHYRYAWARNPMANVTNSQHVPLASQRSDDWRLEETPVHFPTPPGMTAAEAAKPLRGLLTKELELNDIERRIKEAETTITNLKEPFLKEKKAQEEKKAAMEKKLKEGQ